MSICRINNDQNPEGPMCLYFLCIVPTISFVSACWNWDCYPLKLSSTGWSNIEYQLDEMVFDDGFDSMKILHTERCGADCPWQVTTLFWPGSMLPTSVESLEELFCQILLIYSGLLFPNARQCLRCNLLNNHIDYFGLLEDIIHLSV